jgi:uncharacterized MnhB-related membrane protein
MNIMFLLNTLVIIGIVVSAICAVAFKKPLSSVIALGITGGLTSLEFMLLQAPNVGISEASVGAVLSTAIFIIAVKLTTPKEEEEK